MCGIVGVIGRELPDQPLLCRMRDTLTHRGPDDVGAYFGDQASLAFRRLSIIDLQTGHQPMANEAGDVWVVLNGEIYNFPELRRELEAGGHQFATQSDT